MLGGGLLALLAGGLLFDADPPLPAAPDEEPVGLLGIDVRSSLVLPGFEESGSVLADGSVDGLSFASGPAPTNAEHAAKQNVAASMGAMMCAVVMRSLALLSIIGSPPCVDTNVLCSRRSQRQACRATDVPAVENALFPRKTRRGARMTGGSSRAVGVDQQDSLQLAAAPAAMSGGCLLVRNNSLALHPSSEQHDSLIYARRRANR